MRIHRFIQILGIVAVFVPWTGCANTTGYPYQGYPQQPQYQSYPYGYPGQPGQQIQPSPMVGSQQQFQSGMPPGAIQQFPQGSIPQGPIPTYPIPQGYPTMPQGAAPAGYYSQPVAQPNRPWFGS